MSMAPTESFGRKYPVTKLKMLLLCAAYGGADIKLNVLKESNDTCSSCIQSTFEFGLNFAWIHQACSCVLFQIKVFRISYSSDLCF